LIEGRKPNYFISANIASVTNQKAKYTKNKGLEKDFYKELIKQHIKNHGATSRKEIDEILLEKLPEYLSPQQRKVKINNLLSEMVTNSSIKNTGSRKNPNWILIEN